MKEKNKRKWIKICLIYIWKFLLVFQCFPTHNFLFRFHFLRVSLVHSSQCRVFFFSLLKSFFSFISLQNLCLARHFLSSSRQTHPLRHHFLYFLLSYFLRLCYFEKRRLSQILANDACNPGLSYSTPCHFSSTHSFSSPDLQNTLFAVISVEEFEDMTDCGCTIS